MQRRLICLIAISLCAGCLLVGCAAGTPAIAPAAPVAREVTSLPAPYASLQGTWKVTRAQLGRFDAPERIGAVMHFDGNRFRFEGDQGFEVIDIDTSGEPYKIDFWEGGTAVQGVFKIVGNTLTICSAPPNIARPASLDPTAHHRYILTEAVRQP